MLFKIVILATYIFEEGPWPAPITEHWGGGRPWTQHCLPDSRVTRCRGYRDASGGTSKTHLLATKFVITQNGIKLHKCRNPLVPP